MSWIDEQKAWQRHIGKVSNCLTLAMLNYGEGQKQRGEYYIDLAGQYYSELVEEARKTDWFATGEIAPRSGRS